MKTFVMLCALACSTLAAPTLNQNQRNWQNREKKSPTFGKHLVTHDIVDTSYHHGFHQPHYHHEQLGLKKPLFHHGFHDIHHGLGYGLGHHGHGFRSEEEKEADTVTEVTELKSADDVNDNFENGLQNNIKMARKAVENMKHDLAEMESTANARKHWKHSDSESDTTLHENIQTAKEALENVQNSFNHLQAINNEKISAKDAESIQDPELEKMTEEERMAKWKSAIETIQKNVEIANNIKESLTSGKDGEQLKMLPSQEARSSMTKPAIVEAHKKPINDGKKSNTEMEVSASTKVEMREGDAKEESEITKEKSSWHHEAEMKSVDPIKENHPDAPLKPSDDKVTHLERETLQTSMKTSEKEVLHQNGDTKIDSFEMEEQKSVNFKAADHGMTANKAHMQHESHVGPTMIHDTKKARENIEPKNEMGQSAQHSTYLNPTKAADGTIFNTKATMKFRNDEESHHDFNKQAMQNFGEHDKLPRQPASAKSVAIDTTTLMKERDSVAKPLVKEREMDHQASEMKSSQVLLEKQNMDDKAKPDSMKPAKSTDTAMHPSMSSSMRAAENMHVTNGLNHLESARSYGPASYGPSVAISVPSYGPGPGVGLSGGYGAAAPSYGPSVAASAPISVAAVPASHSYSASGSSYGIGASNSGISISLSGAGPRGAVGVFPNAKIGGCAVPLLLSCSPSVVSGSLAKAHPSYSVPAAYGDASSYKKSEQLSSNNKRDVQINKFPLKKARRSFSPILNKKF